MKKFRLIAALTLIHAIISWGLFLSYYGISMGRFDTGEQASVVEKIMSIFSELLLWPIFSPLINWGPSWLIKMFDGLLGYIPLLLNSIIWGLSVSWLYSQIHNMRIHSDRHSAALRGGR